MTPYYEAVTKPKREQAQLLMCMNGAPDTARRAGTIAYCVEVLIDTATVHVRSWTGRGKCKRKAYIFKLGEPSPLEGYALHWPSMTLHKVGEELPPPEHWPELRQRALVPFLGQDVVLPDSFVVGDTVEASRRSYHKRQATKLLRLMPGDYTLLPGNKHIAYRLEQRSGEIVVQTLAPLSVEDGLKSGQAPLFFGGVLLAGRQYLLSPCGTKLYRAGHSEDLFGAQDDVVEQALVFEELRPKDKPVLAPHNVWYEIAPGKVPKVLFHSYKGRTEKIERCPISDGKVSYRDNTYKINMHGVLMPL